VNPAADGEGELTEVDDSDLAEAGNGEITTTDEFQPTEEQREADKNLAVQLVVAFGIGIATIYGAVPGALATMVGPLVTVVLNALGRVSHRRAEHAAETLMAAADAAGLPVAEFFSKAVDDDRRHELFARAMTIAQDTALREKRLALGRALAVGVMGDDARIDEELLFMRAVEDIDEMHIRLLSRLGDGSRLTAKDVAQADPGLGIGVLTLLGQLQSHGLIDSISPVTPGGAMVPEPRYFITDWGRAFLTRLAAMPVT
jgi:hypothetical protein